MSTAKYAGVKLAQADQLRAEAEELKAKMGLAGVVLDLSRTHAWELYAKGLKDLQDKKNYRLRKIPDKGYLPRVDRQRAKLIAEINLLDDLVRAPEVAETDIERFRLRVDECEREASKLEKFGFAKGAK